MLTSGAGASETVVWIVGHRSDERFKVDEKTEKVVVLTLETEKQREKTAKKMVAIC